jgi:hypothetical protein
MKKISIFIQKEIDWAFKHPATNLSKDFQEGYLAGLHRAELIIEKEQKTKKGAK